MQDRPSVDELLAAIEGWLDSEIVPNVPGARGFHGRVAANAIRIIRRELAREDAALAAEWAGLDALVGDEEQPRTRGALRSRLLERNEELCERIRSGEADAGAFASAVRAHVKSVVEEKLRSTNPELLERSQAGQ
jgi:hypothetical protein